MYKIDEVKNQIICGDTLKTLKEFPAESIDMVITSPPYYGLRNYQVEGQIGLEKTLDEYLEKILGITAELKRVLKKTGTMWWNHGDAYNSTPPGNKTGEMEKKLKEGDGVYGRLIKRYGGDNQKWKPKLNYPEKCLMLQNFRLIQKMIDNQKWILRNIIIWHKPNCMPSSVKDRFTVDFEPVFFLTKSKKYWFEPQYDESIWYEKDKRAMTGGITKSGKSITEQGKQYAINKSGSFNKEVGKRNKRCVWKIPKQDLVGNPTYIGFNARYEPVENRNKRCIWKIPTQPFKEAHFATFPEKLIEPMVLAGCPKNGIVLDPFSGSGTTGVVAKKLGRNYILIDLSEKYCEIARQRLRGTPNPLF